MRRNFEDNFRHSKDMDEFAGYGDGCKWSSSSGHMEAIEISIFLGGLCVLRWIVKQFFHFLYPPLAIAEIWLSS